MNAECEAKVVKTKYGCSNWAEIKPETGYASEDTLIASGINCKTSQMLGHPRNNFTYLGPSGIGTWAHHAKQAQSGKTSGFEKPVTRIREGNPRDYFSGEFLNFLEKMIFSVSKHVINFQGIRK